MVVDKGHLTPALCGSSTDTHTPGEQDSVTSSGASKNSSVSLSDAMAVGLRAVEASVGAAPRPACMLGAPADRPSKLQRGGPQHNHINTARISRDHREHC